MAIIDDNNKTNFVFHFGTFYVYICVYFYMVTSWSNCYSLLILNFFPLKTLTFFSLTLNGTSDKTVNATSRINSRQKDASGGAWPRTLYDCLSSLIHLICLVLDEVWSYVLNYVTVAVTGLFIAQVSYKMMCEAGCLCEVPWYLTDIQLLGGTVKIKEVLSLPKEIVRVSWNPSEHSD